jgi:hypothetical protein
LPLWRSYFILTEPFRAKWCRLEQSDYFTTQVTEKVLTMKLRNVLAPLSALVMAAAILLATFNIVSQGQVNVNEQGIVGQYATIEWHN